ncbi:uncharacterized protein Z520_09127 [Fonsecaea multimorphosa CBS 102226]|uniref:Uncharacterized protein n=1 Tax=Fonsecaea multimorphosa CBS 102226 TaxID=1442371 RepID=A0A0D2IDJ7_9EURO|nr:uncharacterized protein Z520_09127 [Fonsecaea multimorphosa CBS 102226]KIX95211.1 hypothetical protein Z520_09127 [Fonsecaea multimorphosa CBS 102226]OAL17295.1 hypothetical protein AYO22_11861 [Fonsecaea multimorphosa]
MVVVDGEHNGYRTVILPLAVTDALVQTAVSSTAASHLWRHDPELRDKAESERIKVIQMLKSAASSHQCSQRVFSVSTWATLLVLLVGEMITGRDDYRYLVRMIGLVRASGVDDIGSETRGFLETQTDTNHRTPYTCGRGRRDTIALEQLRRLVNPIPPDVCGGHSLVWVYFIAAAESGNDDDDEGEAGAEEGNRAFFTSRLRHIYAATGARNIPMGLAMLDKLSHTRHVTGWPDALSMIASSFVM